MHKALEIRKRRFPPVGAMAYYWSLFPILTNDTEVNNGRDVSYTNNTTDGAKIDTLSPLTDRQSRTAFAIIKRDTRRCR